MASEENRSLKNIEGKKLRRIYFDVPLIFLYSVMLAVPYAILVISWGIGKFDFAEWLSAFRTSVLICVGFSLPFIILRALNKRFFGRIVRAVIAFAHGFRFRLWPGIIADLQHTAVSAVVIAILAVLRLAVFAAICHSVHPPENGYKKSTSVQP